MVKEVLFLGQCLKMEISIDLHVLRSPESENHIFSGLSVCMYACVCYQHNSKEKKIHITESPNLVFNIYIIFRCYLKLFMKIRQIVWIQGHNKVFENITAYGRNFSLLHFNKFTLHWIWWNEHISFFGIVKNMSLTEHDTNSTHNLSCLQSHTKEFRYISNYCWKRLAVHLELLYEILK